MRRRRVLGALPPSGGRLRVAVAAAPPLLVGSRGSITVAPARVLPPAAAGVGPQPGRPWHPVRRCACLLAAPAAAVPAAAASNRPPPALHGRRPAGRCPMQRVAARGCGGPFCAFHSRLLWVWRGCDALAAAFDNPRRRSVRRRPPWSAECFPSHIPFPPTRRLEVFTASRVSSAHYILFMSGVAVTGLFRAAAPVSRAQPPLAHPRVCSLEHRRQSTFCRSLRHADSGGQGARFLFRLPVKAASTRALNNVPLLLPVGTLQWTTCKGSR